MTKPGKYGTLFLYRVRYQGPDPCQGEIAYRVWAYNEEHAQLKWEESFDSDWDREQSTLVSIERVRE